MSLLVESAIRNGLISRRTPEQVAASVKPSYSLGDEAPKPNRWAWIGAQLGITGEAAWMAYNGRNGKRRQQVAALIERHGAPRRRNMT